MEPKKRLKSDEPYGDEGRLSHYLGNDDYHGREDDWEEIENPNLDGYEASGNDLEEEERPSPNP